MPPETGEYLSYGRFSIRWIKFLAVFVFAVLLLSFGSGLAKADGPVTGHGQDQSSPMRNGVDPNYVPTAAELKALAAKQAQANQHFEHQHASNQMQPNASGYHSLAPGYFLEPNDFAHRNYCGPAATQVILSARIPLKQIPSIDQVGTDENIDPNSGVYNTAIRDELNRLISPPWYIYSPNETQSVVANAIEIDIDMGYGLDTSLYTGSMPGWGTRDVRHIVAIYAYYDNGTTMTDAYYIETGQSAQGYSGNYGNVAAYNTFYGYISAHSNANNSQVW